MAKSPINYRQAVYYTLPKEAVINRLGLWTLEEDETSITLFIGYGDYIVVSDHNGGTKAVIETQYHSSLKYDRRRLDETLSEYEI